MTSRVGSGVLGCLLVFVSTISLAQSNPSSPEKTSAPSTVLKVTTRLVVVDIVAKNNKGEVVKDLKAEDFTLMEDGKPQEIRSFSFQQGENIARPQIATLPPGVFTNQLGYRPTGALNVILLDALNSNLPDQALMRDAMVKFLSRVPD